MSKRFPIILVSLITGFFVLVLYVNLLGRAAPLSAAAVSAASRDYDPVVVSGIFPGSPIDEVFVYRDVNGSLEQIPFQIDELTSSGTYTTTEDLIMDANDEVVFMAKDLGDKVATPLTTSLPVQGLWYEVEVTDPLSPTFKSWAYIVRSETLTETTSLDYVNFLPSSERIESQSYTLGWEKTDYAGLDFISVDGSANIIDRTKLLVLYRYRQNGEQFTLTEEKVEAPETILVKDGRVRVIVKRGALITKAYATSQRSITPIDLTKLPETVIVDEARVSLDLASTIVNENAVYFNENVPGGVPVDGSPDNVPPTPFTQSWHQISMDQGTFVHMIIADDVQGTHYYKDDDGKNNGELTGDKKAFADAGVKVINPALRYFTYETIYYFLPGGQENIGNELYDLAETPLDARAILIAPEKIFLPLVANK